MTKKDKRRLNDIYINDYYKAHNELLQALERQSIEIINNLSERKKETLSKFVIELDKLNREDYDNNTVFDFANTITLEVSNNKKFDCEYKDGVLKKNVPYLPEFLYFLTEYNEKI